MSLPAWLGAQVARPEVQYDVADSVQTAPGYRLVGDDFYTCIRPVDVPHDPLFEKVVKEYDPGVIFCWRKQRFILPESTETRIYTHNVLARHVKSPKRELQMFHVEMPRNARHPVPNELCIVWEKFDDVYFFEGGPGAYMPWTRELTSYLRKDFLNKRVKDLSHELSKRERAKISRAEGAHRREEEYRKRALQRRIQQLLAMPGDTDKGYREYMAKARGPYQPKRAYSILKGV